MNILYYDRNESLLSLLRVKLRVQLFVIRSETLGFLTLGKSSVTTNVRKMTKVNGDHRIFVYS